MHSINVFIRRAWRNLNRRVSRLYIGKATSSQLTGLRRLGSAENGWFVDDEMPNGSLCYCLGVGRDASYDFALAEAGAEVHSFDPTPHSVEYMSRENKGRVHFHPWGVYDYDGTMRLFRPLSESHGSYFVNDLHLTGKFVDLPCFRLTTIMRLLNHEDIYLLKMDIEGSWFKCLLDIIKSNIFPVILQVEFDSPAPVWKVRKIHKLLRSNGYAVAIRERDNVVYVQNGKRRA